MGAGTYRNYGQLVELDTQRHQANGSLSQSPRTLAHVWFSLEPVSGGETRKGHKVEATVTHVAKMRYRHGVKPKQRLQIGPRNLEIVSVLDVFERRRELQIQCREIV
jgi:SPP1 family predicted phage head-tail adaptor